MNKSKYVLEKTSAITSFVLGILMCFVFFVGLINSFFISDIVDWYIVIESLIIIMISVFLIVFGAQVGLTKIYRPHFSKIFILFSLTFLMTMLYSASITIMFFASLAAAGTAAVSMFFNNNYSQVTSILDNQSETLIEKVEEDNSVKEETLTVNNDINNNLQENDFETKITNLKKLKDKELISEEQYKEEVNKILKNL